jgi:hypothetical protein
MFGGQKDVNAAPTDLAAALASLRNDGPITGAKLFIAGLGDPAGAAGAAQVFSDQSPQPKRLEIVTASDHGTDLFSRSQGSHVEQLIDAWLATYLHLAEAS